MRHKLSLLLVVMLLFAVRAIGWTEEEDWLKTQTSFDPLFKDIHLACQGVSTARGVLSVIYDKSGQIAQLHGIKKEYSNTVILGMLANRRAELTADQLSYFADALISAETAKLQAKTSVEACQNLQPRLEEAIEKAPTELAFQPWKIKKVIKGLKDSLVQANSTSKEGAVLVKELAEVTFLLQKITAQKAIQ